MSMAPPQPRPGEEIPEAPPPPPPIPQSARPLPVRQSPPPPPETSGSPTPADAALEAQGGEIIPEEFRAKPPEAAKVDFSKVTPGPAPEPSTAAAPEIKVDRATEVHGNAAPEAPAKSPEQIEWESQLAGRINVELNIYHSCFQSTRRMVNLIVATTPADSADIGEGQWTGGRRSPIENAEPEIALEVYRQVRREMRQEVKDEQDEVMRALKTLGIDPKNLKGKGRR